MSTYPNATHYSPNFSRRELDCKCGCDTPPAVEKALAAQAQQLELLRAEVGTPLIVHSGYRCPKHNAAVGGAKASEHMTGRATDVSSRTKSHATVRAAAERVPAFKNGGIGKYSWGTHVDSATGNHRPARW